MTASTSYCVESTAVELAATILQSHKVSATAVETAAAILQSGDFTMTASAMRGVMQKRSKNC